MLLHEDLAHDPPRAEVTRQQRLVQALRVAPQAVAPFQRGARPGDPGARELRGQDAVVGRLAGLQALGHRAVGEELHVARGEGAGDPERVRGPLGVEPEEVRGRRRGAEHAAHGRRVVALLVEEVGVDPLADPRGHVVAGDDGREEPPRRRADHFTERE